MNAEATASAPTPSRPSPPRRRIVVVVLVAVALGLPSLRIGFFLDDYHQIALMEGWYDDVEAPPVNLYASFLDFPGNPWWAADEARTGFQRPLASLTLRLDHALFGRRARAWHLHSLAWLAALVAAAALVYRRLPAAAGLLALGLYAVDESHAFPAGILCNRHALVAAVPAFFALAAHLRWREHGWRPGARLAPAAFAVALACGETALAVMAYVLAYELFAAPGGPWRRLRAVTPSAAVAVAYVVLYAAFELGPRATGFYTNPLERPVDFLLGLAARVPALLAGALAALPASLWIDPRAQPWLVAVGAGAALAFGLWWWRRRRHLEPAERRALAWLVPGALGSMLPLVAAPPSDRQLMVPGLGLSALVAVALLDAWRGWRARRRGDATDGRSPWPAAVAVALLALLHLGVAPLGRVAAQLGAAGLAQRLEEVAVDVGRLAGTSEAGPPRHAVLVNAPDFFVFAYPLVVHDFLYGAGRLGWDPLALTPRELRLTRTGERTLELEPVGGPLLDTWWEGLLRGDVAPLATGERIASDLFDVEVLAATDAGPTRVAFRFHRRLDDASLHLLAWRDGALERLEPPAPGETVRVTTGPGLAGRL